MSQCAPGTDVRSLRFATCRGVTCRVVGAMLSLVLAAGCVARKPAGIVPNAHSAKRAQPSGTIAIRIRPDRPQFRYLQPQDKGEGAVRGATKGFKAGARIFKGDGEKHSTFSDVVWGTVGVAVSTVGTVGGAIGGAARGVSSQRRLESERAITNAVAQADFNQMLREYLVQTTRGQRHQPFVLEGTVSEEPAAPESVLDVMVQGLQLKGKKGINPLLRLELSLRTSLRRVGGGGTILTRESVYVSSTAAKFTEWGVDDAALFQRELQNGCHFLTEQIARDWLRQP